MRCAKKLCRLALVGGYVSPTKMTYQWTMNVKIAYIIGENDLVSEGLGSLLVLSSSRMGIR